MTNEVVSPKEMLSVRTDPDGKTHVRINFSSLDLLQTCQRKAHYVLNRELRSTRESPPLIFGSAIHKAMEVWYCAPASSRRSASAECDDSQANMLVGQEPLAHGSCVRCAACFAFLEIAKPLALIPDEDKRSPANGLVILNAYFDTYSSDPFEVLADELGPVCERGLEMSLVETASLRITYFGTIDMVLRNTQTGTILIVDHKTTSSLGSDFFNRLNPNFQYVGYVSLAQNTLLLATDTFMVNGIQVAKTKTGFSRQMIGITATALTEFRQTVQYEVESWLRSQRAEFWPMSAPTSCGQWGGCQFRPICEVPADLRESVTSALFQTQGASA